MIKVNILSKYYLLTPIFLLVELIWGMNLRVNLPWSGDYLIYLYMGICFVFGGFFLKKQAHLNIFALIESSVNIFMLFKSVYLPVFTMANNLDKAEGLKVGTDNIVHVIIVGFILLYAFYNNPLIKKKS